MTHHDSPGLVAAVAEWRSDVESGYSLYESTIHAAWGLLLGELLDICLACKGEGTVMVQRPDRADHPDACRRCEGRGLRLTERGEQLLNFVEAFRAGPV